MKKIILCFMFVLAMSVSVEAGIENTKYGLVRQIAKNRWVASLDRTKPENYDKYGLGIIDENDNVLLPMVYSEINNIYGESHMYEVHHNGKVGIVDDDGNFAIDTKYDYFIRSYTCDDFVNCDDKAEHYICYGFVNCDDKVECYIIENNRRSKFYKSFPGKVVFQAAGNGKFDYCVEVKTKNRIREKHGLMDSKLNVIVKPQYDNCINIDENGYAIVYKNSKNIENIDYCFKKYTGGRCGVINEMGKVVIPIKYSNVEHRYNGLYRCTGESIFALSSEIDLRIWGFYLVMLNLVYKLAIAVAIIIAIRRVWRLVKHKKDN